MKRIVGRVAGCLWAVSALLGAPAMAAETVKVGMKNGAFTPAAVTIHVGDRVVWINDDEDGRHRVDFDDPAISASGDLKSGKEYAVVFTKAGEFSYNCRYHKDYGMRGKVVVASPAK